MRIVATLIMIMSINCYADSYLCVADKASGFQFTKPNWEASNFRTENKYLIQASGVDRFPLQVIKVGGRVPVIMCKEEFNSAGFLHCDSGGPLDMLGIVLGEHFTFNHKNLRYMRVVPRGYINVVPGNEISDSKSGTPHIEIGKCSRI
jgi:hypothetical protein